MNKQKAIQIIKDAPDDWEYFATSNERFYTKASDRWFFHSGSRWLECEKLTPLYSSRASMITKSEILKIAEGEEMKYPYIGGIDSDCKTLFLDECYGIAMEHNQLDITGIPEHAWSERQFKNITHEYLQNTYGEVVSPEHAEFIVELAELHGFVIGCSSSNPMVFEFSGDSINTYSIEPELFAYNDESKQITIPLPPKADPLKNAGDNLILGCEQDFKKARAVASDLRKDMRCSDELPSKADEWPQVGSTVRWCNGTYGGEVKALDGGFAWVKSNLGDHYVTEYIEKLQKPKTPDEELRDDIELIIKESLDEDYSPSANAEHIRDEILSRYNITKKPQ